MNTFTRWLPACFLELGTKGSMKTVITLVKSLPLKLRSSVKVNKWKIAV